MKAARNELELEIYSGWKAFVELISFENRLKERRKERRMMLIAEKKIAMRQVRSETILKGKIV